ncbi:Pleckstrin-like proteiny domain-containing family B member 1 [Nibea albiflora]|uniref:Pleckstrin-like proteiny domain-containing family B member 1 n=1 Tax=Nibea albiflora TaxID=240163 RepID=A0ACB7F1S2_NIBAL|nr:Pleckstrin-like proteiny domain-containing family B member 1 [Nibea albiflora]
MDRHGPGSCHGAQDVSKVLAWENLKKGDFSGLASDRYVTPPETNPRDNLVVIQLRGGSTVNLCANSEDESIAWKLTLLETRRNPVFTYDPYDDSYEAIPINSYHTVYIRPGVGPGTHQVVVQRDPFDGVMENIALGLLAGMAAGTAMRSFLWMPFFFC